MRHGLTKRWNGCETILGNRYLFYSPQMLSWRHFQLWSTKSSNRDKPDYPTEDFTISESQNPWIGVSEVHDIRRSVDEEALK